jgi:hypothetical protein
MTSETTLQDVYAARAAAAFDTVRRLSEAAIKRNDKKLEDYTEPRTSAARYVVALTEESAVARTVADEAAKLADVLRQDGERTAAERCDGIRRWYGQQLGSLLDAVAGSWSEPLRWQAQAEVLKAISQADGWGRSAVDQHIVATDDLAIRRNELELQATAELGELTEKLSRARSEAKKTELREDIEKLIAIRDKTREDQQLAVESFPGRDKLVRLVTTDDRYLHAW